MQEVSSEQDLQDAIALKVFDSDESALTDMLVRYGPRLERALLKRFFPGRYGKGPKGIFRVPQ